MTRTHNQQLADRHEQDLAKRLPGGWYRSAASGAKMEKSDVNTVPDGTDFLPMVECKSTSKKSYNVKLELLRELKERAINRGWERRPTLAIRFYDENDRVLDDWIAVPQEDYLTMLEWKPNAR